MTFLLAQIESTIEQAERLAGQNDRVLFIVTLILFFVAGGVAMKWFMGQLKERDIALETQRVANDEKIARLYTELGQVRENFNQYLIAAAREMHQVIAQNNDIIKANSLVVQENTEMSQKKMSVLDEIQQQLKAQLASHIEVTHRK